MASQKREQGLGLMDRVYLWLFDGRYIWDDKQNRYSQRDIEFSFFTEFILDGFAGKQSNIRSMTYSMSSF